MKAWSISSPAKPRQLPPSLIQQQQQQQQEQTQQISHPYPTVSRNNNNSRQIYPSSLLPLPLPSSSSLRITIPVTPTTPSPSPLVTHTHALHHTHHHTTNTSKLSRSPSPSPSSSSSFSSHPQPQTIKTMDTKNAIAPKKPRPLSLSLQPISVTTTPSKPDEIKLEISPDLPISSKSSELTRPKHSTHSNQVTRPPITQERSDPEHDFDDQTQDQWVICSRHTYCLLYSVLCMGFSMLTYYVSTHYDSLRFFYSMAYFWAGLSGNLFFACLLPFSPNQVADVLKKLHDYTLDTENDRDILSIQQSILLASFGFACLFVSLGIENGSQMYTYTVLWYPFTFFFSGLAYSVLVSLVYYHLAPKDVKKAIKIVMDYH